MPPILELREAMGKWVEDVNLNFASGSRFWVDVAIALSPDLSLSSTASDAQIRQAMLARAETHIETALGLGWVLDIDPPDIELDGDLVGLPGREHIMHQGRLRMRLRWPL